MTWATIIDLLVKLLGDWLKSLLQKTAKKMPGVEDFDSPSRALLQKAHDSLPPLRNVFKRAAIRRAMDFAPAVVENKGKLTKGQKDELAVLCAKAAAE